MNRSIRAFSLLVSSMACFVSEVRSQEEAEVTSRSFSILDVQDLVRRGPEDPAPIVPRGELLYSARRERSKIPSFGNERLHGKNPVDLPPPNASTPSDPNDRLRKFVRNTAAGMLGPDFSEGADLDGIVDLTVSQGQLVIVAPRDLHSILTGLVESLRVQSSRYQVELVALPQAAGFDGMSDEHRRALPAVADEDWSALRAHPDAWSATTEIRAGDWSMVGNDRVESMLTDYQIDQTGVIPVAEPVVVATPGGREIQLRATPCAGRPDVLVDVVYGGFKATSRSIKLEDPWGPLDLPQTEESLLSTSLSMRPGKPKLVGVTGKVAIFARIEGGPTAAAGNVARMDRYDLRFLTRGVGQRQWWSSPREESEGLDPERVLESLVTMCGGDTFWGQDGSVNEFGGAFFVSRVDASEGLKEFVAAKSELASRGMFLELSRVELSKAVGAALLRNSTGFVLGDDAERAIATTDSRTSYYLSGLENETHAVRDARIETYLTEFQNVSGGTGFSILERMDPGTSPCGEGAEFRVRFRRSGRGHATIRLEGIETKLEGVRKVEARVPGLGPSSRRSTLSGNQSTRESDRVHAETAVKVLELELPEQSARYWRVERRVPVGKLVLLEARTTEDGTLAMLVARLQ